MGALLPVKSRLVQANNQWGWIKNHRLNLYLRNGIEVEFIIKTMYSEYVYHVCLKDRMGTIWDNDRV
ncbi:hypothetical protein CQ058_23205 [Bacillus sp. MYb56]|nr:hypothetical protein [Bacillus mycoides]PRD07937.1 hypothetical protein CQ058_23205 [Bacillus sp. MYb56]QWI20264.1 hypothetical protein EXW34_02370 [Bacillus mycoides]